MGELTDEAKAEIKNAMQILKEDWAVSTIKKLAGSSSGSNGPDNSGGNDGSNNPSGSGGNGPTPPPPKGQEGSPKHDGEGEPKKSGLWWGTE